MDRREDFPWTYDQFQRYRVLEAFLDRFYHREGVSVLDVGGVSPHRTGSTVWLPLKRLVTGRGFVLDIRSAREPGFIRGDGTRLPFKDNCFDVVASLDVLEHIPADKRPEFLGELSRVARGSVVLSAPFHDPEIERVEALLFREIKDLHGVEHEQLREHARNGLPEVDDVSGFLGRRFPANIDFPYGNLSRWLILQLIENFFLFRRNSPAILGRLDRWMAAGDGSQEFAAPFSRHYWIASREIPPGELETGRTVLRARLLEPAVGFSEEDSRELNREIAAFFESGRVTAVVVSPGRGKRLPECLNHLLTQKVDFDLEVLVWTLHPDAAKEEKLRSQFPGVGCVVSGPGDGAPQALLRIASRAAGGFILLLSDTILLPLDSTQNLFDALRRDPEADLISPRTVFKRYFTPAWHGRGNSPTKILAGRLPRRRPKEGTVPFRWVFNECLFFRKEALFDRKMNRGRLCRRNVFLWEKAGKDRGADAARWTIVPQTVFKTR